jgi:hypothetical protein
MAKEGVLWSSACLKKFAQLMDPDDGFNSWKRCITCALGQMELKRQGLNQWEAASFQSD